jgi:hypothetical protein
MPHSVFLAGDMAAGSGVAKQQIRMASHESDDGFRGPQVLIGLPAPPLARIAK